MIRSLLAVAAALSVLAGTVGAADSHGNHASWGVGQASCHQFSRASESAADDFKHYLLGYLTAYNMLAPSTYQATGSNKTTDNLQWLHDYCDAHPMESYERAIQQLLISLDDRRFTVEPGAAGGWGRAPRTATPTNSR